MIIGYVGGAFKSVHLGHWSLIECSASVCEITKLFVSDQDRQRPGEFFVSGKKMKQVWEKYLIPTLPPSVVLQFSTTSPVKDIYLALKEEDDKNNIHFIFTDEIDSNRYTCSKLALFAPNLVSKGLVQVHVVPRITSEFLSGTKMRFFLASGLFDDFVAGLPVKVRHCGKEIWELLLKN